MPRYDNRKTAAQRKYGYKWQKARAGYLKKHPFCAEHAKRGRTVVATVVDHIVPHRDDMQLFWDKSNWQSLCNHCHVSHKQRFEKSGRVIGCDESGMPIDPGHHWNQSKG